MVFCVIAILSFALQNLCCKEYGRRFPSTLYAQSVMITISITVVAAIMAAFGGVKPLSPAGYLIAAAFGLFFVLTLATMTMAMNAGHMGMTILIQNSSLIVPVIFGILVWNEAMSLNKGIGIALILVLLVLSAFADGSTGDKSKWNKKRWLILTGLAFIGDSGLSILQALMSKECATTDSVTFTFWTSVFTIAISLLIVLWFVIRRKTEPLMDTRAAKTGMALTCLGIGVGTAGGNCFSISALTQLPSVVLFPVRMDGLILVMWLAGIAIYKEKVTKAGIIMLIVGLAGILLLNL